MKHLFLTALGLALLAGPACGADKNPVVVMETSMGTIKIELNAEKAPISTQNFLKYVEDKHYDGTIFHRVISDFMIQGGGFEPGMKEKKTRDPIKNESGNGLKNERGTIAMARTRALDSATAQFYINVVDNPNLDKGQYAVFGKVVEGMDVVDKIRKVKVADRGEHEKVPVDDVIIKSVRVQK
jgi:cyclophilin family peptidyl-prolyl cis-trans isomerase